MGSFCSKCGTAIENQKVKCPNCGYQLDKNNKKLTAGLLGIFLGPLGVHQFYLGEIRKGITQIVITLCTNGMGGIIGVAEGILILLGIIKVKNS